MKIKILTLVCTLALAACGSDNDDTNPTNPTNPTTDETAKALINEVSGIVLRESLGDGLIDSLVYGTDEILDNNIKCESGSYQKTANTVTLNKCVGVFEVEGKGSASGVIKFKQINDHSRDYEFNDLNVSFADGENQVINGGLNVNDLPSVATITVNQIKAVIKQFDQSKKLRTVNYVVDNYKLVWSAQDATNVKLQLSGKIAATGGENGDFSVAYDNTNQPFFVKKDAKNDDIVSSPYSGVMTIIDTKNNKNITTISALNDQTAQYKAVLDDKVLFDETKKWSEILEY